MESNFSMIEKIPPKGVSFSDFICTFAMSCYDLRLFYLTWQNPEQLFVAQELINKVKSKCCGIKEQQVMSNLQSALARTFRIRS